MASLLLMTKHLGIKPSEALGIDDPYTAFCLNEVAAYHLARIANGDEPHWFISPDSQTQAGNRATIAQLEAQGMVTVQYAD